MTKPKPEDEDEAANLLASLRRHGQVVETNDEAAPLPPGVTHVLVDGPTGKRLVEKRKSFF